MAKPAPANSFNKLPVELRDKIWSYVGFGDFAILRCCKMLSQDFTRFLSELELYIDISPHQRPNTRYPTSITFRDQHNHLATVYPAFLNFDSPEREAVARLMKLEYGRFRCIKLHLQPLDPSDPGQFVRCWSCMAWVVDFFRRRGVCRRSTLLQVIFHGNFETWMQQSVKGERKLWSKVELAKNTDLERMLHLLAVLRRFSVTIDLPRNCPDTTADTELGKVLEHAQREVVKTREFGWNNCKFRRKWQWFHRWCEVTESMMIASKLYMFASVMELALDTMDGDCAAMLRLERLAFWSRGYRNNVLHRVSVVCGAVRTWPEHCFERDRCSVGVEAINWARHAFNPLGLLRAGSTTENHGTRRRLVYSRQEILYHDRDPSTRDTFDTEAWFRAYPHGIPKRGSPDYDTQLTMHAHSITPRRDCKCTTLYCICRASYQIHAPRDTVLFHRTTPDRFSKAKKFRALG